MRKNWLASSKNKRERGLSLLEVCMALGVISAVMAGTYMYFSSGKSQADVSRTFMQVAEVESAIVAWKSARRSYSGLSAVSLYSTDLLPPDMNPSGTTGLMMAASSPVLIGSTTIGGVANDGYSMTLNNLNPEACVSLALKPHKDNHYRTLIANSSGGGSVSVDPATDVEAIADNCGSRNVSTVTYQYY